MMKAIESAVVKIDECRRACYKPQTVVVVLVVTALYLLATHYFATLDQTHFELATKELQFHSCIVPQFPLIEGVAAPFADLLVGRISQLCHKSNELSKYLEDRSSYFIKFASLIHSYVEMGKDVKKFLALVHRNFHYQLEDLKESRAAEVWNLYVYRVSEPLVEIAFKASNARRAYFSMGIAKLLDVMIVD